jgi:hypothetical protein
MLHPRLARRERSAHPKKDIRDNLCNSIAAMTLSSEKRTIRPLGRTSTFRCASSGSTFNFRVTAAKYSLGER